LEVGSVYAGCISETEGTTVLGPVPNAELFFSTVGFLVFEVLVLLSAKVKLLSETPEFGMDLGKESSSGTLLAATFCDFVGLGILDLISATLLPLL